jgi:hypothetical protein
LLLRTCNREPKVQLLARIYSDVHWTYGTGFEACLFGAHLVMSRQQQGDHVCAVSSGSDFAGDPRCNGSYCNGGAEYDASRGIGHRSKNCAFSSLRQADSGWRRQEEIEQKRPNY